MNKDKLSRILKTKGFYLSLLTGVLAIAAICFVYFNTNNSDNKNNLTDLNGNPITQQADSDKQKANVPAEDKTVVSENAKKNEVNKTTKTAAPDLSNKSLAEDKNDTSKAVAANSKASTLSFDENAKFEWPVKGDVIIPYDMEHGVQFLTLGQYKCSDAIVISAEVGTKVKSATKAKVLSIKKNDETGLTVTTDIGSGYQVIYGQLKSVKVKVGDTIDAGAVIGKIAKPSKYYVVEGPNLYFKVTENKEAVNPMYLLD
ncbi:MAG: M23 family metallopeptidase [bacterium]|nr:M23 family metallopeptidase [bacterium]